MLIQFSVKNYKTFKDLNTLSMVASNYDKRLIDENTFVSRKFNFRLLKSAVIYGANASGKSKYFEAFQVFKDIIYNSSKESRSKDEIDVVPFILDTKSEKEPTSFELIFANKQVQYRYGFEANRQRITREWLYIKNSTQEKEVFFRTAQKFEDAGSLSIATELIKKSMIRQNALLLSVLAQFNDVTAKKIMDQLNNIAAISGVRQESYEGFTIHELDNETRIKKVEIIEFLDKADFGILDVKPTHLDVNNLPADMPTQIKDMIKDAVTKTKKKVSFYEDVITSRKKYSNGKLLNELAAMSMEDDESSGTKKYFALSGPVLDTLRSGATLFVDELDSQLHPLLVRHLVKLFNSKVYNPKNAQLIFNTHDVNLLNSDIFRRDQVWFSEKDKFGSARLFSLSDIKLPNDLKIRNDENYEKNYLQGKYGAIPYVSKLNVVH
jgi:AAA15 family ATPase/GTPase